MQRKDDTLLLLWLLTEDLRSRAGILHPAAVSSQIDMSLAQQFAYRFKVFSCIFRLSTGANETQTTSFRHFES
jgi:hypothetical protein